MHNLKENFQELTEMLDTVMLEKKDTRTEEEKDKYWDEVYERDIAQQRAEEKEKKILKKHSLVW